MYVWLRIFGGLILTLGSVGFLLERNWETKSIGIALVVIALFLLRPISSYLHFRPFKHR
jgi:hypothetical protein